jgi:hypothetical protein
VFDKDLLSFDDFLGRADLPLASLDIATGSGGVVALALHGERVGGALTPRALRKARGTLQVSAWFGPAPDGEGQAPSALTLMPQPGAVGAPKVVHCGQGSCLYEEPLFIGLSVRIEAVTGLEPRAPASASPPCTPRLPAAAAAEQGSPRRWWARRKRQRSDSDAPHHDEAADGAGWPHLDGLGGGEDLTSEWDAASTQGDEPAAAGGNMAAGAAAGRRAPPTGKFLYCRVVVGEQAQVTKAVRERAQGRAEWGQSLAFALPLPLRDRPVRLEVYRTGSTQRKGRAIFGAVVPLLQLLPPAEGPAPDLKAALPSQLPLMELATGESSAAMAVRVAVSDMDGRRALYAQTLGGEGPERHAGPAIDLDGPSELELMEHVPPGDAVLNPRTARRLAALTEAQVAAWEARRQARRRVAGALWALPGNTLAAAGRWGQWGVSQTASVAAWGATAALSAAGWQGEAAPPAAAAERAADAPPLPTVPQPLARLRLRLEDLHLPRDRAGSTSHLFVVAKCGACWLRTPLAPAAGGARVELRWEADLPILDPATMLLLAVFDKTFAKGSTPKVSPPPAPPR